MALRVVIKVEVADAAWRCKSRAPRSEEGGPCSAKHPCPPSASGSLLTWLQVAELCQRAHLEVLQVKGLGLSACKVPHQMPVDHTDAAQTDQGPQQQRHLEGRNRLLVKGGEEKLAFTPTSKLRILPDGRGRQNL